MKQNDLPLGSLIDKLNEVREERRQIALRDKELSAEYSGLEELVRTRLAAEGVDKASGKKASVSITRSTVATIKDWDALCKWVKRTGHFQLFQRRISDPAFRELLDLKKAVIPGLEAFEKETLNLRVNS